MAVLGCRDFPAVSACSSGTECLVMEAHGHAARNDAHACGAVLATGILYLAVFLGTAHCTTPTNGPTLHADTMSAVAVTHSLMTWLLNKCYGHERSGTIKTNLSTEQRAKLARPSRRRTKKWQSSNAAARPG